MGKDAKYIVRLEPDERERLQSLVDAGRGSKTARQRARVLLKADQAEGAPGWTDERVAEFAEVSLSTVHRVRQQLVEEG
ncbi:MAG TPA: helix-turn-helix domain-containing protein, partial [Lacipirellulaceae bacterium]|nr:helix-turn-helix domain-containing protein [Lacipirellulaceae bacterium]